MRTSRRQDILDAALRLLGSAGADGFTASALAAAAGVSKANVFHHFQSLDDIVIESFEQFALGLDLMQPPPGTRFRAWLLEMGRTAFGLGGEAAPLARAYTVFVARALFDERLRARVLRSVELGCEALAGIVERTWPDVPVRPDAQTLATLIFMAGDGVAIHMQAFPERREIIAAAWVLLVDRLAPPEMEDTP